MVDWTLQCPGGRARPGIGHHGVLVGRTRAGIGHCNVLEAGPELRLGTSVLVGGARAGIGHCSALEAGSRSRLAPYCLGGQGQRTTRLDTSVPWGAVPRLLGNPLREA